MSRRTWVLGNWKQNHRREAAQHCAHGIVSGLTEALHEPHPSAGEIVVGIAPAYLSLEVTHRQTQTHPAMVLLAQDVAAQESGAFTGEVGPAMLREVNVDGAIIGHSERRAYYGDDDALVAAKLQAALEAGLIAVLCVGERLDSRDEGSHETTVVSQLSKSLSHVKQEQLTPRLIIAYEPVWAIGTGRTATPQQAAQMHGAIRRWMGEQWGDAGSDRSVLYGGSVKPTNAAELLAAGDVDGFLVGGASLDPASFLGIVRAAATTVRPG